MGRRSLKAFIHLQTEHLHKALYSFVALQTSFDVSTPHFCSQFWLSFHYQYWQAISAMEILIVYFMSLSLMASRDYKAVRVMSIFFLSLYNADKCLDGIFQSLQYMELSLCRGHTHAIFCYWIFCKDGTPGVAHQLSRAPFRHLLFTFFEKEDDCASASRPCQVWHFASQLKKITLNEAWHQQVQAPNIVVTSKETVVLSISRQVLTVNKVLTKIFRTNC